MIQLATHQDLVTWALVASGLQPTAEKLLYCKVVANVSTSGYRLLETLRENATKASYVRFLQVIFHPYGSKGDLPKNHQMVTRYLVPILKNTSSLEGVCADGNSMNAADQTLRELGYALR